jgi:hypothetical protein
MVKQVMTMRLRPTGTVMTADQTAVLEIEMKTNAEYRPVPIKAPTREDECYAISGNYEEFRNRGR